jgi:hypothetical protein
MAIPASNQKIPAAFQQRGKLAVPLSISARIEETVTGLVEFHQRKAPPLFSGGATLRGDNRTQVSAPPLSSFINLIVKFPSRV